MVPILDKSSPAKIIDDTKELTERSFTFFMLFVMVIGYSLLTFMVIKNQQLMEFDASLHSSPFCGYGLTMYY